jgi:small-conductance mechanosensitive channel
VRSSAACRLAMETKVADSYAGAQTERRIGWLTLLFGFTAAAIFAILQRKPWAAGLATGTILAWLNFRWLKRALDALVLASRAQEGREKPRLPRATYFLALLRYGLLALSVYVIYTYLHVPLGSMIVGMCALGVAAIAASVWEIMSPVN